MPRPKKNKIKKAKEFDQIVEDAKQEAPFKFRLDLCGKIFEGTGATALEALKTLPVPEKITTKGLLIITHGEQEKKINLLIPKVKRLFYPNFQEIVIKQLVYGL